jgi:hypothetical protein
MVTVKCFQNMKEMGFENREMKGKCAQEDWYFDQLGSVVEEGWNVVDEYGDNGRTTHYLHLRIFS